MQERWACPSMRTVQAPHWPSPHPYLVPVRSRWSQGGQQAGLRVCLDGVRTVVYRKMKGSHGELRESGSLESDPLSKMIYPLQGARKTEVPQVRVRSLDANLGSGTSAPT